MVFSVYKRDFYCQEAGNIISKPKILIDNNNIQKAEKLETYVLVTANVS